MSTSRWERWGPIAGLAFVVLFVVGLLMNNLPSADDSALKIANYYNDGGKRAVIIIASYVLWLAGLFFFWFVASLRTRLLAVEGAPGRITSIAFGGGLIFIGMLFVAAACFASVAGDITFGGENFASVDGARYLPELGYPVLVIGGMFAAIAMIDAASILILRTNVLPKWIGYYGFFAAVALLFGGFFIPMLAFVLWVLFVSIAMLGEGQTTTAPAAPPPATPMP
jgi:hypothetical protein